MRVAIALLFLVGCFDHHGREDGADGGVRDGGAADADRRDADDAGICFCASDLDCPSDSECIDFSCEDCLCQPEVIPGCDDCMCMTDADCPPPPPFGDCVRARCADDCSCTFVSDDGICGPDAYCDDDTFLCTPLVEVLVLLRSDFVPGVEFDRITVTSGTEEQEYLPSPDDPFLSMGVIVAVFRARPGSDLFAALDLWLGDAIVASREAVLVVEEGAMFAFTVAH